MSIKLYMAPMEGITTYIYRNAFKKYYGGFDKYFYGFICGSKLNNKEKNDLKAEHNLGMNVVPQVLTNNSDTFISVTKRLNDMGYDEVNLNLGCPSGTVVAKGRGAGFLSKPEELRHFLEDIFSAGLKDISIKTRLGMESREEWDVLLDIYKDFPIKELIIHARYKKDMYSPGVHMEEFEKAYEIAGMDVYDNNASKLGKHGFWNLCFNGDIMSVEDFQKIESSFPQVNSVMLGRGMIIDGNLLGKIKEAKNEEDARENEMLSDKDRFFAFHDEILNGYKEMLSGDRNVLFKMMELWSYWQRELQVPDKLMKNLRKSKTINEYSFNVEIIKGSL